jgi:glycine betaine/proline transport system substrate-binding protein
VFIAHHTNLTLREEIMKKSTKLLVALLFFATPALAADVVIPDPNYASGRATAFAVSAIIQEALGLEVEMATTTAVPVIWEAMSRGKGEIDIWTETWLPNQSGLADRYVNKEKTVTISKKYISAIQGYCISKAMSEKHSITSVFDLANPENAQLFDSNGDGKGEIWIGPQGWQSTNIETIRARDYGFADFFELQSTDEAVATAGLDAAYKAGKPWVGYCYGPHQNFAIYELFLLKEPAHNPETFVMVQPAVDADWKAKSKVASAYADTTIRISWSNSLAERQPQLVLLLEQIQLSADDVNKWSLEIVNGGDPALITSKWAKANRKLIAEWMPK